MDQLTDEAIRALIKEYKETGSTAARNRVVEDTIPKVRRMVAKYQIYNFPTYNLDDMLQETAIIVMEAIEAFNVEFEVTFQKYVVTAIGRKVKSVTARSAFNVQLDRYNVKRLSVFWRERSRLDAAGLPSDDLAVFASLEWPDTHSRKRFQNLLSLTGKNWIGSSSGEEEQSIADVAPARDDGRVAAEKREDDRLNVERRLKPIRPSLANLVRQHYGIGCEPMTLAEIAASQGCTYEHARFRLRSALERLRDKVETEDGCTRVVIPTKPKPTGRYELKQHVHDTIDELIAAGVTPKYRDVARRSGCSLTLVFKAFKERKRAAVA